MQDCLPFRAWVALPRVVEGTAASDAFSASTIASQRVPEGISTTQTDLSSARVIQTN